MPNIDGLTGLSVTAGVDNYAFPYTSVRKLNPSIFK